MQYIGNGILRNLQGSADQKAARAEPTAHRLSTSVAPFEHLHESEARDTQTFLARNADQLAI